MSDNYAVINGKKIELTEEHLKALGVKTRKNPFKRVAAEEYYYCVKKTTNYYEGKLGRSYYDVNLFFSLNLPVIGDIIDFGASGTTIEMDATYDCNSTRCLFRY